MNLLQYLILQGVITLSILPIYIIVVNLRYRKKKEK